MVIIATLATVVASQALISGAFSLTQQSMQLGYLPRFPLVHTSEHTEGQIFIPRVNQFMMIFCIALVLGFGSSSKLAGAYGIAVVSTMTITTILLFSIARRIWNWSMASACALVGFFLLIDLAFLISNMAKVFHGGWVSLLIGAGIFALMSTWRRGRKILSKEMFNKSMALEQFIKTVEHEKPFRVKGVAVFMTPTMNVAPAVMLHHFKHNQILHERVVLLTIMTRHIPWVKLTERVRVTDLGQGIFQVVAAYGYMQTPNVFEVFECCAAAGLSTQREQFTYYLGRETLLTTGPSSMIQWRKKLFSFMSRNAQPATSFFGIPPERVMEVGLQLEV